MRYVLTLICITILGILIYSSSASAGSNDDAIMAVDFVYADNAGADSIEDTVTKAQGETLYTYIIAQDVVNLATYNCVIHFNPTALTYANAYAEFAPFLKNIFNSAGGSLLALQVDDSKKTEGEISMTAALAGTTGAPSGNGLLGILEFTVQTTDETEISFGPSLTDNYFVSTAGLPAGISYPTDLRGGTVNPAIDPNIVDRKVVTLNGKNAKSVHFGAGTRKMNLQFNTAQSSSFSGRLRGQRHTKKNPAAGPRVFPYYWKFSAEQVIGTFSATLTFHYDDADISAAGLNENLLIIGRYDSGTWTIMPTTRDPVNNMLSTTTTAFSDWVIGDDESSLPVELSSFSAFTVDGIVILKWRTETEVNNIGFSIYRGEEKDGNYTKVAFVNGAGNTAMPNDYQFTDKKAEADKTYFYYIEDIDIAGERSRSEIIKVVVPPAKPVEPIPKEFRLLQNYPNPFNPSTWLPYQLAKDVPVTIGIYNKKGRLIRTINLGKKNAGVYITKDKAAYFSGRDSEGSKVASGVYFYTLQAGEFRATQKMVIMK